MPQRAGKAIDFRRPGGGPVVLTYGGLTAPDADRPRASLEPRARRPHAPAARRRHAARATRVTIDPLVQQGSKLTPTAGGRRRPVRVERLALAPTATPRWSARPRRAARPARPGCSRAARASGREQAELPATGESGRSSASAQGVALSDDGGTAIVGGPGDDSALGAAWVYRRDVPACGRCSRSSSRRPPPSRTAQGSAGASRLPTTATRRCSAGRSPASDDGAVWAFSFNPLSVPVWTQAQKLPGSERRNDSAPSSGGASRCPATARASRP